MESIKNKVKDAIENGKNVSDLRRRLFEIYDYISVPKNSDKYTYILGGFKVSGIVYDEIFTLVKMGKYVPAITYLRQEVDGNLGLKEAKDIVDGLKAIICQK